MNEGPVQPLDVVVLGEGEQHLVADDGEGQEEDGTQCHSQGEGTEPQPAQGTSIWVRAPLGVTAPLCHPVSPAPTGHSVLAEEEDSGNGTSRNLRNSVDSSILVIMNCGDKIPNQRAVGGGAAWSIAPCPLPKFSPLQMLQKSSQGIWALLPPRVSQQPGCGRTRAPGEVKSSGGTGRTLRRLSVAVRAALAALLPPVKSVCFLKWVMMKWQRM